MGYGCMGLSGFYGPVKPDEERFQVRGLILFSASFANSSFIGP